MSLSPFFAMIMVILYQVDRGTGVSQGQYWNCVHSSGVRDGLPVLQSHRGTGLAVQEGILCVWQGKGGKDSA